MNAKMGRALESLVVQRDEMKQRVRTMVAHTDRITRQLAAMERAIAALQELHAIDGWVKPAPVNRGDHPASSEAGAAHGTPPPGRGMLTSVTPGTLPDRIIAALKTADKAITANEIAGHVGSAAGIVAMTLTRIADPRVERVGDRWYRWNPAPKPADGLDRAGGSLREAQEGVA